MSMIKIAQFAQKWTYRLYELADEWVYRLETRRYPRKGWMGGE